MSTIIIAVLAIILPPLSMICYLEFSYAIYRSHYNLDKYLMLLIDKSISTFSQRLSDGINLEQNKIYVHKVLTDSDYYGYEKN